MEHAIEDSKFNIEDVVHSAEKAGEAMKCLSELIDRSREEHPEFYMVDAETGENRGSVVQDDYDPYTGKYAFVSPDDDTSDEEYEDAAQEAYDNLVRSLIEAGGEIRELNDEKKRLIFALKEAVVWLNYFLTTERDDIYYDEASEVRCRAEYLLMELEE